MCIRDSSKTLGAPYYADGTRQGLLNAMQEWNVSNALVMHIAVKPTQQETINNFAAACEGNGIYSFGSVHPKSPDPAAEVLSLIHI